MLLVAGPNGSGKSSLLRAFAGLDAPLAPLGASVGADQAAPARLSASELARRVHLVHAEAKDGLAGLTVRGEFRLRRLPAPDDQALAPLLDRDVATLSTGEARRTAMAIAHARTGPAGSAPLLLLDEPADGLDPAGRERLATLVAGAAQEGAVVVADHSGWASDHATRTLRLAPEPAAPRRGLPLQGTGPVVLQAPPATVHRGGRALRLPAVALGPGLHAVTGPNGSGKTTLLERLAGLRDADGVLVAGGPPSPGGTVRMLQAGGMRWSTHATVRDALRGVDDAGLVPAALLDRHPLALSAGEGQRVALAQALGAAAPAHLLDEPEAHLDATARAALLDAVRRRVAAGACVVAATHDPWLLALAASRVEVPA